jgi:putative acetyltransferase
LFQLRDARDQDAPGLIALIGAVFSEYPGCVLDVDGELPELRRIASDFAEHGGRFWVAEQDAVIAGCIGFAPSAQAGGIELKKLYVSRALREAGLGSRLLELVEHAAEQLGATFIELWSDTRFVTAHRFYEKRGYVRTARTRELGDKSDTVEYHFRKELAPTRR